jgi:hypothetical protein
LYPFLIRNFRLWGIRLTIIGLTLNLLVMSVNGGLMPVDEAGVAAVGRHAPGQLEVGDHIPRTKNVLLDPDSARLPELSDSIIIRLPGPLTRAVSIGDCFIAIGVALTAGQLIMRRTDVMSMPENQSD